MKRISPVLDLECPSFGSSNVEGRRAGPATREQIACDRHTRFLLELNARRLAVVDRDVETIIAIHVRDRTVAACLRDTAA